MSHFLMIFCFSLLMVTFAVGQGNPCDNENGGCSHYCVPNAGGHKCACPDPLKLKDDGRHCGAEGLQLTCDTNSMQIDLPRELFHEMRDEHLRLIDPNCGAQSNKSFFSLSTSHTECGTKSKVIGGYIVYTNKVMEMPNKGSAVVTTVGKEEVKVPFSCYYLDREIVTAVGFKPTAKKLYVNVKGRGNYKLNLNFYKSGSYDQGKGLSNMYSEDDFPVSVKLRERLYFEASLDTREKDLRVFASNCCSTPTEDHEATHKFRHALIVEGCPVDPSVQFHSSPSPTVQRFSVQAFKFLSSHPFVYIHCRIYVCDANDPNSRCKQECKRPKGGGQGAHRDEKHKQEGGDEKQSTPEKLHANKKMAAHHIAKQEKKLATQHQQKKETKSAPHPMQKKSSNVKVHPLKKTVKKIHSPLTSAKDKKAVHPVNKNVELKKKETKKEPEVKPVVKDQSDAKKDKSETKDINQMFADLFSHVMKRDVSHVKKDTTSGFVEISKGPFVVSEKRRVNSRSNDAEAAKAKKNEIREDVKEDETKTGSSLSVSTTDAVLAVMTVASVMALVGVIYLGRQVTKRINPYEYTPLTVKTS